MEAVASELVEINVGGDGDHWDAVDVRRGKTRDDIRRSGTGGGDDNAGFAGGARVAVRGVGSALLVRCQNVRDPVAVFI